MFCVFCYIERKIRLCFVHLVLVKFFHNVIVWRCLMPVDAFPAYRPIAIFLVTLALANDLYRYQAVKKCNRNYLKVHGPTEFFIAARPIMRWWHWLNKNSVLVLLMDSDAIDSLCRYSVLEFKHFTGILSLWVPGTLLDCDPRAWLFWRSWLSCLSCQQERWTCWHPRILFPWIS